MSVALWEARGVAVGHEGARANTLAESCGQGRDGPGQRDSPAHLLFGAHTRALPSCERRSGWLAPGHEALSASIFALADEGNLSKMVASVMFHRIYCELRANFIAGE